MSLRLKIAGLLQSLYGLSGGGGSSFLSVSKWVQLAAGRSRVTTTDVTTVSITPSAITGLTATVVAGRKYFGELVVFCSEATAVDGLRLDFDGGTATMTSFEAQGYVTDTIGVRSLARTSALATDITDTTTTGDSMAVVKFAFVVNAGGTFIPRVAKEADAAGATLTVKVNTHMWIEDCP